MSFKHSPTATSARAIQGRRKAESTRASFRLVMFGTGVLLLVVMSSWARLSASAKPPFQASVTAPSLQARSVTPDVSTVAVQPFTDGWELVWKIQGDPLKGPGYVATDTQGNVFVADFDAKSIFKFGSDGKLLTRWGGFGNQAGQFEFPEAIVVDRDNNIYVADFSRNLIQKFDNNGRFITQWTTEPPNGPRGLGIDSQDNIYVALHRPHDHYLYKVDSSGHLLLAWGTTGTGDGQIAAAGYGGILAIAVDERGFLYVIDHLNERIQQFDLNGTFVASWSWRNLSFGPTYQVAVDPDGYVYIPFGNDGTLGKFDSQGNLLARWQSPQIENASLKMNVHLGFDDQANLYLSFDTPQKTVLKFKPSSRRVTPLAVTQTSGSTGTPAH